MLKSLQYGLKSVRFPGAKSWNRLPVIIRESQSIKVFRSTMKAHFFATQYYRGAIVCGLCWVRGLPWVSGGEVIFPWGFLLGVATVLHPVWLACEGTSLTFLCITSLA